MNRLEFELSTIKTFSSNVDDGFENLIESVKEMQKLTYSFKKSGESRTLNLFNNFMEKELENKAKSLLVNKDKYHNLFTTIIIPQYEELFSKNKESVGK